MKKKILLSSTFIFLFVTLFNCTNNGPFLSDENDITSLTFLTDINPNLFREPSVKIDEENKTIRFHNPQLDLTTLVPTFELSYGATLLLDDNELISGSSPVDFSNEVMLTVKAEDGTTTPWTIVMTREIVDLKDFLSLCPLEDPNIDIIRSDFEIRLNEDIVNNFPCAEPYYLMDEPTSDALNGEFYSETTKLQALRFLYYLDYDNPHIVAWSDKRLYDWIASKIDGIIIEDGLTAGGTCCYSLDGKTFIKIPNVREQAGNSVKSSPNLFLGFSLMGISIILHESRHVDGFPHTNCCARGFGCDLNLDFNNPGAYGISVWWNKIQYEDIYEFDKCALETHYEGVNYDLTRIFNPNIWSDHFCSGPFNYQFPFAALNKCK